MAIYKIEQDTEYTIQSAAIQIVRLPSELLACLPHNTLRFSAKCGLLKYLFPQNFKYSLQPYLKFLLCLRL